MDGNPLNEIPDTRRRMSPVAMFLAGAGATALCAICGLAVFGAGLYAGTRQSASQPPAEAPGTSTPLALPLVMNRAQSPTNNAMLPAASTPTLVNTTVIPTATAPMVLLATATLPAPVVQIPGCIPTGEAQSATVSRVVDGDTIHVVLDADGKDHSVRYIGVNSPEMSGQAYAQEATQRNWQLVANKRVMLYRDVSETDRYGRLLRYVLADGVFVNYQLVLNGAAMASSYPPDTACIPIFQQAETNARSASAGMWAVPAVPLATSASQPCTCQMPDLNCKDLGTHAKAQACFDYCMSKGFGDVYNLDGNLDGKACTSLP